MKTDDKTLDFRRNLELIRHFRAQLQALGDEGTIELLRSLDSEAFANSDVRSILRVKRNAAWLRLARLVELGFVEKRGYSYNVTQTGYFLVKSLARALRSAATGSAPAPDNALTEAVAKLGPEAVEWAYAKGRIDRAEYLRYKKELTDLGALVTRDVAQQ